MKKLSTPEADVTILRSHMTSVAHPGIELKQHLHFTDHAERNDTRFLSLAKWDQLQARREFCCGSNRALALCCRYPRISLDPFIHHRHLKSSCLARRTRTTRGGVTDWRCLTRSAWGIECLMCQSGTWVRWGTYPHSIEHTSHSVSLG